MPSAIPLFTIESRIKRSLRRHLRDLGFTKNADGSLVPPSEGKDTLRRMHAAQRAERLASEASFITKNWPLLKHHFANGADVDPASITPELELIESNTWQSDLFRLASLTWSVPVSQGYGRRMRFLVWDRHNNKLIGLIALGDPVFNLSVRDRHIGWTPNDRKQRLVGMLDAFVLGSLPPYNRLLGGKLVAALIRSIEVRDAFRKKYHDSKGIISKKRKHAELVAVTTTSALGRSAVYNRVRLGAITYLKPLGYTEGWGHFHVPESVFAEVRGYLRRRRRKYAKGFKYGDGPNWRLRALRLAMALVGLRPELLRHGIKREVFITEFASNTRLILLGKRKRPKYDDLQSVAEIGSLARERYRLWRATVESPFGPPQPWGKGMDRLSKKDPFALDRQTFAFRPFELVGVAAGVAKTGDHAEWLGKIMSRIDQDHPLTLRQSLFLGLARSIVRPQQVTSKPLSVDVSSIGLGELATAIWLKSEFDGPIRFEGLQSGEQELQVLLRRTLLEPVDAIDGVDALIVAKVVRDAIADSLTEVAAEAGKLGLRTRAAVREIVAICRRFETSARQILKRHANRSTLTITDEYDVQDLLHSLLLSRFDDVRSEEWTPSYAGKSARTDFLLKPEQVFIEAKKTRNGLRDREVTEQLAIDVGYYRQHPSCRALVCFVYDPDHLIQNPAAVEGDLSGVRDGLLVQVVVCPRPA